MTDQSAKVTLKQFYAAFRHFPGWATAVFAGLPFLSWLAKLASFEKIQGVLFPPLGSVQSIAIPGTVLFLLLTPLLAFFLFRNRSTKFAVFASLAAAFILFLVHCGLYIAFVRTVTIPSRDAAIFVSIGYKRSAFAEANFAGESDLDILKARGPYEDQIRLLWTVKSIMAVRLGLLASYTLTLASVVFLLSWSVRADLDP